MDLINASAEPCEGRFNNTLFRFEPNELVNVPDDAGAHLARKLKPRGVVIVRYGDLPEKIRLEALREVVAFHRHQIKAHEDQVKVAVDQRNPIPSEPDSYVIAKRSLGIYEAELARVEKEEAERETAEVQSKMKESLSVKPQTVDLDDLDQSQLRTMVKSLGGDVDMRHGPKKLKAQIAALQEAADDD